MLSDASSLACYDVRFSDMVEQRCLSMVDMTHNCDDWSSGHEVVFVVDFFADSLAHFRAYIFSLESELVSHDVDGFSVESLVDRHHDADAHASADDLVYRHVHHGSQFAYGHKLCEFQGFAFSSLFHQLFVETLLHGFTFLPSVFCTLFVLVFIGETCKCFLYLACHIFLVYLNRLLRLVFGFVLVFASASLLVVGITLVVGVALVVATSIFFLFVRPALVSCSFYVNSLIIDAHSFLSFAIVHGFFLSFLSSFLFGFFLWSCALVESVKVDFSEHVHLRSKFFLASECENFVVVSRLLSLFVLTIIDRSR